MALWACKDCTAAYAVGLPCCPQCGSTDHEEDSMPKISKLGGPSYDPGSGPGTGAAPGAEDTDAGDAAASAAAPPGTTPEPAPAAADTGMEEASATPAKTQPKKADT